MPEPNQPTGFSPVSLWADPEALNSGHLLLWGGETESARRGVHRNEASVGAEATYGLSQSALGRSTLYLFDEFISTQASPFDFCSQQIEF